MKITEKDLHLLSFEKVDVTAAESGYPNDWYYYTYDFPNFCLISSDNEQAKSEGWHVEFFEAEKIRFTEAKDLYDLMWLIKKNIV